MSTYVYGIIPVPRAVFDDLPSGVGEPPTRVRLVTEAGLGAVVSDTPEGLRAKRRDLMAHQELLTALIEHGPVLPMRFGNVAEDDDAVRAILRDRAEYFEERLRALDGRVEYNVKAAHREEAVLRDILDQDQEVRELNARSRRSGDQGDRLLLGERVAAAVRQRETKDAELVRTALLPLAVRVSDGPPVRDCVCNLSFLVERTAASDFSAAVAQLEKEHGHLDLRAHGPMPPYSFVEAAPRSA